MLGQHVDFCILCLSGGFEHLREESERTRAHRGPDVPGARRLAEVCLTPASAAAPSSALAKSPRQSPALSAALPPGGRRPAFLRQHAIGARRHRPPLTSPTEEARQHKVASLPDAGHNTTQQLLFSLGHTQ